MSPTDLITTLMGKIKGRVRNRISKVVWTEVRKEMEEFLPIISQLIDFQNSRKKNWQSYHDHTKDLLGNISYYKGLKDRLLMAGIPVEEVEIDISDFEYWLNKFQ